MMDLPRSQLSLYYQVQTPSYVQMAAECGSMLPQCRHISGQHGTTKYYHALYDKRR